MTLRVPARHLVGRGLREPEPYMKRCQEQDMIRSAILVTAGCLVWSHATGGSQLADVVCFGYLGLCAVWLWAR